MGCIGIVLLALMNAGALPAVEHLVHALRVMEWVRAGAVMMMGLGISFGG